MSRHEVRMFLNTTAKHGKFHSGQNSPGAHLRPKGTLWLCRRQFEIWGGSIGDKYLALIAPILREEKRDKWCSR